MTTSQSVIKYDGESRRRLWDRSGLFRSLTLLQIYAMELHCRLIFSIYMREYPFLGVSCNCIWWGIRFHIFFPPPKGGFTYLTAHHFSVHWPQQCSVFCPCSQYVQFSSVHFEPIQIKLALFVQWTDWRSSNKQFFLSKSCVNVVEFMISGSQSYMRL